MQNIIQNIRIKFTNTKNILRTQESGKKKILITGGLGFIFSYVTEYFVQKGWEVVVIDDMSDGSFPEIIDGSFIYYNYHMENPKVVDLILRENPDYIIHASSIADVDYSIREPYITFRKNTLSTMHVFEACRNLPSLKKLIYVSTDEVYGECDRKMNEDDAMAPKNPYSCTKAAGSFIRLVYENTYPELKGKTAETRFCNAFGARQTPTRIMSAIKKSIDEGYSIPLHQEGGGYREYIYVKNIPPVVDLILEKGLGVFNVSLNDGFTASELIDIAEKVTGKKVTTHPALRSGMDRRYQADSSRIRKLGWKPEYTFEEGLRKYLCEEK